MTTLKTSEEQEVQDAEDLEQPDESQPEGVEAEVTEEEEAERAEESEADTEPETEDDDNSAQGSLADSQNALRGLLDYDQLQEVRLALTARRSDLEKHRKKGNDLGVDENDAARRIRIIDGSDVRWGLKKLFAEEVTTYTRDLFFDRAPGTNGSAGEEDREDEGEVDEDSEGPQATDAGAEPEEAELEELEAEVSEDDEMDIPF